MNWKERFDQAFKDWKIHHEGVPCINDALAKHAIKSFIEKEMEKLIDDFGDLFTQWQKDGYIDRAEILKSQLKSKWLNKC